MGAALTLHENVDFTGTAAPNSVALAIGQTYIMVATQHVYYKHGPTGQAAVTANTGVLLPAFIPYEFTVRDSSMQSVSAIRFAADGRLNIARQGF